MKPLSISFYRQTDVVQVAAQLLGKVLHTRWDNEHCYARIVETEAYNGVVDKASHAYGNRRTNRTETMYATGGIAYVYLCYGMHHLFNVVTGKKDVPQAVLIRAADPMFGIEHMLERRNKNNWMLHSPKDPAVWHKPWAFIPCTAAKALRDNRFGLPMMVSVTTNQTLLLHPALG